MLEISPTSKASIDFLSFKIRGMNPEGIFGMTSSFKFWNPLANVSHVFVLILVSKSYESVSKLDLQSCKLTLEQSHLKEMCSYYLSHKNDRVYFDC